MSNFHGKKLKFGVLVVQEGYSYADIKKIALKAERLGFDSFWLNDHLMPYPRPSDKDFLECWTTLSALAAETHHLRLGSLVLCNSYRHPSLVAKMASSLDVISGGRLELGLGAGWYRMEYEAYGIPFPAWRKRIAQLEEGIEIIHRMWTKEKSSYDGKHYRIKDAICYPKPVQEPHPPIWIGGEGNELLRMTARLADGCNFVFKTPEEYEERFKALAKYCSELGRKPEEVWKSVTLMVLVDEDEKGLERKLSSHLPQGASEEEFIRRHVVGTPDVCAERLKEYAKLGVSHFMLLFPDAQKLDSLRLFAKHINPALKISK